jgi:hypothetical protein
VPLSNAAPPQPDRIGLVHERERCPHTCMRAVALVDVGRTRIERAKSRMLHCSRRVGVGGSHCLHSRAAALCSLHLLGQPICSMSRQDKKVRSSMSGFGVLRFGRTAGLCTLYLEMVITRARYEWPKACCDSCHQGNGERQPGIEERKRRLNFRGRPLALAELCRLQFSNLARKLGLRFSQLTDDPVVF